MQWVEHHLSDSGRFREACHQQAGAEATVKGLTALYIHQYPRAQKVLRKLPRVTQMLSSQIVRSVSALKTAEACDTASSKQGAEPLTVTAHS